MSAERCSCGAEWNDVAEECAEGHAFGEGDQLRVENANLRAALIDVLRSAVPHPAQHPTMWGAWRRAEALLGIPPELSRTIGTSDRALEARLMATPAPSKESP